MVTFAEQTERISLLRSRVREVEDFPRKGIWTQDVTPLFQDATLFQIMIAELADLLRDEEFDAVAGVESRGFMFGAPLATALKKRFIPVAKSYGERQGTIRQAYTYEYSSDVLELPKGIVAEGTRVLIVDDQVVTGGSVLAAAALLKRLGATIAGFAFILTQTHYDGLASLADYPVYALFEKNPEHT